ncbi:NAD(P)/FAD-dependent oxidoreductase [Gordonia sp. NPDC003950]
MTSFGSDGSPTPRVPHHRPRIAVVGSGVAGLTAAYRLSAHASVTLFEADDRLGGHAHTHLVDVPATDGSPATTLAVDSGFIVHNDRTYPTLQAMFAELGVPTQDTDMSMSVHSELTGLEYAGALGVSGLFPTMRTLTRGRYLRMLGEVVRFHRAARKLLDDSAADDSAADDSAADGSADVALADFVRRERFSDYFVENFLLPLVAAVWSCDAQTAAEYPARYLFTFLDHHGMLTVFGSPTWRTVVGGSVTYVNAIADRVVARGGQIRLNTPVRRIDDLAASIAIATDDGELEMFDAAVVATHPHQALRALAAPTPDQHSVLSAITYDPKPAVLHTDISLLPRARRAWASWNYQIRPDSVSPDSSNRDSSNPGSSNADSISAAPNPTPDTVERAATTVHGDALDGSGVAVTYDLTRLMRLPTTAPRMLVTLGRTDLVDPASVIAEMTYEHPVYTTESVAAQRRLAQINTDRLVFAGAYHGWGFHEDGAASGAGAAELLIATLGENDRREANHRMLQQDPT